MVKVISWNIAHREQAWRDLCNTDADIALVQEAPEPPADMPPPFEYRPATWRTAGAGHRPWRAAVVKLSSRIDVEWLEPTPIEKAQAGDFTVSRAGTLDAAIVTPPTGRAVSTSVRQPVSEFTEAPPRARSGKGPGRREAVAVCL